ncbi:hypothetical protein EVAR_34517_1 [Eumeta japonica]|uniref:Uncharacterized protein n=1 Tax=Eumeta variegata TaxID=151549 RepID=A0A4C1Z6U1_EUMVA|nr:hypothetical protein EVAR_34517_1 [Eumeta japonica]
MRARFLYSYCVSIAPLKWVAVAMQRRRFFLLARCHRVGDGGRRWRPARAEPPGRARGPSCEINRLWEGTPRRWEVPPPGLRVSLGGGDRLLFDDPHACFLLVGLMKKTQRFAHGGDIKASCTGKEHLQAVGMSRGPRAGNTVRSGNRPPAEFARASAPDGIPKVKELYLGFAMPKHLRYNDINRVARALGGFLRRPRPRLWAFVKQCVQLAVHFGRALKATVSFINVPDTAGNVTSASGLPYHICIPVCIAVTSGHGNQMNMFPTASHRELARSRDKYLDDIAASLTIDILQLRRPSFTLVC